MSRVYGRGRSRERSRERTPPSRYYDGGHRSSNRNSNDYRHGRDDRDDGVPKSLHSVHIRGLVSNIKSHQVEEFLERKIGGPLKTIFFKPDKAEKNTEIAIRFDDQRKAKICVESLHKTYMLGSTVYIDYYKDINRFMNHIESKQKYDDHRDFSSRGRTRSRSPSRRDRYSPTWDKRRRTPESSYSAKPYDNRGSEHDVRVISPQSTQKRTLLPTPDMDSKPIMHYHSLPVKPMQDNILPSFNQPPPTLPPILPPVMNTQYTPSNSTASSLPQFSQPPPIIRTVATKILSSGYVIDPPAAKEQPTESKFSSSTYPPQSSFDAKAPPPRTVSNPKETWRTETEEFKLAQVGPSSRGQTPKKGPPPVYKPEFRTESSSGRLRLGALTAEKSREEARQEKMMRLSPQAFEKVEAKLQQIEKDLNTDRETYRFVTRSIIKKDPGLEDRINHALTEVIEDLTADYMKKLDEYIDVFVNE